MGIWWGRIAGTALVAALVVTAVAACSAAPSTPPGPTATPTATARTPDPSLLDLSQIRAAIEREYSGQLLGIGDGAGVVIVAFQSTAEVAAADVIARYGAKVRVTVGGFPYPSPPATTNACAARVATLIDPGALRATIEMPSATIGHAVSFAATVRLTNTGSAAISIVTGQPMFIFLFEPGGTVPVGLFAGPVGGTGMQFGLESGGSKSIPAIGGTASCDLRLGYELPDGPYVARAKVEIDQTGPSSGLPTGVFLSDPLPITVATK